MEIKRVLSGILAAAVLSSVFTIPVHAEENVFFSSDEVGEYCSKVETQYYGWEFSDQNQGYRITLIGGDDHPLYILDLLNKMPDQPSSESSGSYGFENDVSFDISNHELDEIFQGCMKDISDAPEDVPLIDSGSVSENGFYASGGRIYNENDSFGQPCYTEDYVTGQGIYTKNVLLGKENIIFELMQEMKGQCKLYYIHNEANRYLDNGFTPDRAGYADMYSKRGIFDDEYKCDRKATMTIDEFDALFGTNIKPKWDRFFYLNIISGNIVSSFYNKPEVSDPRFLSSLYIYFMNELENEFDISKLSEYSLMFEPIVWLYNMSTAGYYHLNPSQNGWQGASCNPGLTAELYDIPTFDFYGTITELAFLQIESDTQLNEWKNVIGFVGKEFWRNSSGGNYYVSYDSGAWLWGAVNTSFMQGAAMMLRSGGLNAGDTQVKTSSEFVSEYSTLDYTTYFETVHSLRSSYVVNNLAVAVLDYHPPLTYFAQDYEYRTDTEVVTSVKLTNNSKADFLPLYKEVEEYEAGGETEPAAVGAMLEYTDENGNALGDQVISELGLPDFVSIQGVGASDNFDAERSEGFEDTPSNEAYLYFKWKTPSEPQKINVTARFVGNNNKDPLYIDPDVGSVQGDTAEYNGRSFTTVTFSCDIKDTMGELKASAVPPDTIGGFMDKPDGASSEEKADKYAENAEVYQKYSEYYALNGKHKEFDMSELLDDPVNEPDKVTRRNWFEYSAYIDSSDDRVKLRMNEYRANSWLQPQEYTSEWVSLPFRPIVLHDNVPASEKLLSSGKYLPSIPSGYGFSFAYTEDYAGNKGIPVTDEYMEAIKNSCTMFQNGIMLFPEFGYAADKVCVIETAFETDGDEGTFDCTHALAVNDNSKYKDDASAVRDISGTDGLRSRVHFIPVWFPDKTEYNVEAVMFDYWTPAGQIYDHETYSVYVDGNIYDIWFAAKSDRNQIK